MGTRNNFLVAFSLTLAAAVTALGQGGAYTSIDFPGASQTLAWGINKSGDISGSYTLANVSHGFKLIQGQFITIDFPGATYTDVRGINDRGDVTGQYRLADGVNHGFATRGDQFITVDFPNATATLGWGIGPSGEVVGMYTIGGQNQGFKFSGNEYVTVDRPGATNITATGINAAGEISGIGMLAGLVHGFLFSDGEYTVLDVPASTYTNATALTAHGEVIGRYVAPGGTGYGYVLKDGVFRTVAFPGATFTGAAAMNLRGEIAGRYQNADGAFHGFLLNGLPAECTGSAPRVTLTANGPAINHASDSKLVSAANPAMSGEALSLLATGLGATQPEVDPGTPFPSNPPAVVTSTVEVRVNGKPAEVLAAVGLPGGVDEYQVDFRIPPDTMKGLAVVQLGVGMAIDNSVKIMIQ